MTTGMESNSKIIDEHLSLSPEDLTKIIYGYLKAVENNSKAGNLKLSDTLDSLIELLESKQKEQEALRYIEAHNAREQENGVKKSKKGQRVFKIRKDEKQLQKQLLKNVFEQRWEVGLIKQAEFWKWFKNYSNRNITPLEFTEELNKANKLKDVYINLFMRLESDKNLEPESNYLYRSRIDWGVQAFKASFCKHSGFDILPDRILLRLLKMIISDDLFNGNSWEGRLKSLRNCPQDLVPRIKFLKDNYLKKESQSKLKNDLKVIEWNVVKEINKIRSKKEEVFAFFHSRPQLAKLPVSRLSWEPLPPGESGTKKVIEHFRRQARTGFSFRERYDESRLDKIHKLWPNQCFIGKKGFDGYVIYSFERTDRVVLECPFYGNATYVLKDNWQTISKLSKWEAKTRYPRHVIVINHNETWFERLKSNLA